MQRETPKINPQSTKIPTPAAIAIPMGGVQTPETALEPITCEATAVPLAFPLEMVCAAVVSACDVVDPVPDDTAPALQRHVSLH
jgi:hypothetical protein